LNDHMTVIMCYIVSQSVIMMSWVIPNAECARCSGEIRAVSLRAPLRDHRNIRVQDYYKSSYGQLQSGVQWLLECPNLALSPSLYVNRSKQMYRYSSHSYVIRISFNVLHVHSSNNGRCRSWCIVNAAAATFCGKEGRKDVGNRAFY
jgi:hypothetical protein